MAVFPDWGSPKRTSSVGRANWVGLDVDVVGVAATMRSNKGVGHAAASASRVVSRAIHWIWRWTSWRRGPCQMSALPVVY